MSGHLSAGTTTDGYLFEIVKEVRKDVSDVPLVFHDLSESGLSPMGHEAFYEEVRKSVRN